MQYFFSILFLLVTAIFVIGIRRAHLMSKKSVELIIKYEHDKNNTKLLEDIFNSINNDWVLSRILRKNNATIEDIRQLHSKLMTWGDFRKYNRYIPITSFFNASALNYLLKHKNDDAKSLTQKMMNHFNI